VLTAQGTGTPSTLRILTDANNYILVSSLESTLPLSQPTVFNNARIRTDANGYLIVTDGASGVGFAPNNATYITQTANSGLSAEQALSSLSTGLMNVTTTTGAITAIANVAAGQVLTSGTPAAYSATPSITSLTASAPSTFNNAGIVVTSTDGIVTANSTASTGAVTVQMSPRNRLRGTAWDTAASQTVDFFTENLPATAATPTGTWKLGYSLNGAAATYPATISSSGTLTLLNNMNYSGNLQRAARVVLLGTGATITSGFSTSTPSIAGSASSFNVTIAATPGITGTVAFNGTFSAVPSMGCTNTVTANPVQAVPTTTTVVLNGVWVANDVIRCFAIGY
jgi:hypothetical protein